MRVGWDLLGGGWRSARRCCEMRASTRLRSSSSFCSFLRNASASFGSSTSIVSTRRGFCGSRRQGAQPCFCLFYTRVLDVRCSSSEIITDLNDTKAERSRMYGCVVATKAASLCLLVSYITLAATSRRSHFLDRLQRDLNRASSTKPTFEAGDSLVESSRGAPKAAYLQGASSSLKLQLMSDSDSTPTMARLTGSRKR